MFSNTIGIAGLRTLRLWSLITFVPLCQGESFCFELLKRTPAAPEHSDIPNACGQKRNSGLSSGWEMAQPNTLRSPSAIEPAHYHLVTQGFVIAVITAVTLPRASWKSVLNFYSRSMFINRPLNQLCLTSCRSVLSTFLFFIFFLPTGQCLWTQHDPLLKEGANLLGSLVLQVDLWRAGDGSYLGDGVSPDFGSYAFDCCFTGTNAWDNLDKPQHSPPDVTKVLGPTIPSTRPERPNLWGAWLVHSLLRPNWK